MQDALTTTVEMFRSAGLGTNLEKTKAIVCNTGYIWGKWSKSEYKCRDTGEGETFMERNRSRISCSECGVTVLA